MMLTANDMVIQVINIKGEKESYEKQHNAAVNFIEKYFVSKEWHSKIELKKNENGRPFINDGIAYDITISHTFNLILVAIFPRTLVLGIDIQRITKPLHLESFTKYDLVSDYWCSDGAVQMSLKESLGKYLGMGLLCNPRVYCIESVKRYVQTGLFTCQFKQFPTVSGIGMVVNGYIVTAVFTSEHLNLMEQQFIRMKELIYNYGNSHDRHAKENNFG